MKRETKLTRRETLLKLHRRRRRAVAFRLRPRRALARRARRARIGRDADAYRSSARCSRRARRWRANIGPRTFRPISVPTARPRPTIPTTRTRAPTASPTGGSRSAAWSTTELKLSLADLRALAVAHADHPPRLRRRLELHRAMERRAAGERAGGGAAEARGALHRALLRRHARTVARRQWPLLRDDRSRRRRASADDPRLRDERRAAAGRARRAAEARVERQLGYKMAKYVMRIEAIDSFAALGRGRGGFWEDRGYEWYARNLSHASPQFARRSLTGGAPC